MNAQQTTTYDVVIIGGGAGGIFTQKSTRKPMADVMPKKATWHQTTAKSIDPDPESAVLTSGQTLGYRRLIVAPGFVVDWSASSELAAKSQSAAVDLLAVNVTGQRVA